MSASSEKHRVLQDFQRYIGRNQLHGTYLAINLRALILDWLAQEHNRTHYHIDARPPHEVVALRSFVEDTLRARWTQKAITTRRKNKQRKRQQEHAAMQLPLRLDDE